MYSMWVDVRRLLEIEIKRVVQFGQVDFDANLSKNIYRTKKNAYCKVQKDMARAEMNVSRGIFRLLQFRVAERKHHTASKRTRVSIFKACFRWVY